MPVRLQATNQAKEAPPSQARDPVANQAKEAQASPAKVMALTTMKWISSMLVMITMVIMDQVNQEKVRASQRRVEREAQASLLEIHQVRAERIPKLVAENMDMPRILTSQERVQSHLKLRVLRASENQGKERVIGSIMMAVVGITEIWRRIVVL